MFHVTRPLVLASGSPRRRQFLYDLGLTFEVVSPGNAEPLPEAGEEPAAYAIRSACCKAVAVAQARPDAVVIGADTIVVLDGAVIGKPKDSHDALHMLTQLAGRTHTVITGVCLVLPGDEVESLHCASRVRFHAWSHDVLAAYAATDEPLDKAGAYAVQGVGSFLVAAIDGSWSNVVGLPVTELMERLLAHNIVRVGQA